MVHMSKSASFSSRLVSAYRSDGTVRRICTSVFSISIICILATIVVDGLGFLRGSQLAVHPWIAVYMDRSVPEMYGYVLSLGTALLLLGCYLRFSIRVFVFWACFYVFVAVDDAFSYHEEFGMVLVQTLGLTALPGLRPVDSGELIAWALAGFVLLVPLGWSLMKRQSGTWSVFFLFGIIGAALFFFGAMVDMLHELFTGPLRRMVNWTEDGGELLVQSLALAVALVLYRSGEAIIVDQPAADRSIRVPGTSAAV